MAAEEFWEDLGLSVALLVQEALRGQDVVRVAGRLKKSESLLYKWANPGSEQQPSLRQFLLLCRITGNYEPLGRVARACGFVLAPVGEPLAAMRVLVEELGR